MKKIWFKVSSTEIRNLLAIIITLGCFSLLLLLIVKPVPSDNKDILNIAIGFIFGTGFAGVISFFYGASKADGISKSETIEKKTTISE